MTVKKINQDDARQLAIAYEAFEDHRSKGEHTRVIVWAMMLAGAQERTGIELVSPSRLKEIANHARARENDPVKTEVQRAAALVADEINDLRDVVAKAMAEAHGNGMSYVDTVYHVMREVAK